MERLRARRSRSSRSSRLLRVCGLACVPNVCAAAAFRLRGLGHDPRRSGAVASSFPHDFLESFFPASRRCCFLASAGPLAAGFDGQPFRGFGQPVLCTRRGEAPRSADSLRVGVCVSSGSPRPSDRCEVVSLRVCWFRVLGVCGGPGRVHTRRPPKHGTGEGSTAVDVSAFA